MARGLCPNGGCVGAMQGKLGILSWIYVRGRSVDACRGCVCAFAEEPVEGVRELPEQLGELAEQPLEILD